ncbi:MAG: Cardiolipin synthetase [uncultured Corynebacteriales bacterium]|uniref:Cardiolipin synthetase n=1 Tax=uncultured Mycobacteriales bacterium TaxID=581187 RepID=A0A6J4H928_9ACTN|nr:MAG: Cardiolipin synthetase [uncultured Corynebacteriales bacterium]
MTDTSTTDAGREQQAPELDDRQHRLRRTMESLTGIAFTEGNRITVLRNGDRIFPAMLAAIDGADHSVDLMTYVYWKGDIATRFAEALSAAARRGVRVRLLIDAVGGLQIERGLVNRMDDAGVHVEWFRKPWLNSPLKQNHRCHRKVLVVDESIAFTGGVGIAEEWTGDARDRNEWRDTHVEVRGPAVDGLRAAFVQNWAETGSDLYDDGDTFPQQPQSGTSVAQVVCGSASIGWDNLQTTFRVLLDSATERLSLASAYFAPDDFFLERLCAAAQRGVQVDVLLPGPGADKRVCQLASEAAYDRLTSCGVRVWNFQPSMMHAKIMIVDGRVAAVGSSNFNRRSLDHDEEVVLVTLDTEMAEALSADFDADLERSELIDLERWRNRSRRQKLLEVATTPLRRFF